MPKLTPHNATITTATIEVRTLTVGARQVTQSVFRQLIEEDVLHPLDATVTGTPWGIVNFHPDKCEDAKEHLHVVWQKGDELRRAHVCAPSVAAHKHLQAGLYAEALIANGLNPRDKRALPGPNRVQIVGGSGDGALGFTRFTHRGVLFHGPVRKEFIVAYYGGRDALSSEELWGRVRYVAGSDATAESIAERLPAAAYHQSWQVLAELPQLFIGR